MYGIVRANGNRLLTHSAVLRYSRPINVHSRAVNWYSPYSSDGLPPQDAFGPERWSMPTYEYMCKKCGPFTQLRAMAECELPSECPECGARAPRVLLTAPSCLTASAEARQTGAKYERITDGLHEPPPYLRDPAGMTKKLKRAQKARARASGPPD
jgi:putative FmdB family regulatory protein